MKERPPKLNTSAKLNISARRIFIITVVILVIISSLVSGYYFMQGGLFDKWFGGDDSNSISYETEASIPDMMTEYGDEKHSIYYESNNDNPLADIHEHDIYTRTVRIITSYGGTNDSERFTITRQKQKYKAESDSRILVYDGETLYINYGTHILNTKTDNSTYYEEIGLTSLEDIRSMAQDAEHYSVVFEVSDDPRIINASIQDNTHMEIRMEFRISLESGLVFSERFYINDAAYRTVLTESFELAAFETFSEDYFRIPD